VWSDVLDFLETAEFDDLLLPGWIDRTGPYPTLQPLLFDACLRAENGLIQFTAVNNSGGLHLRLVDQIDYGDRRDDPDEELAAASVGAHFLSASHSLRCTAMRLFTNNESIPDDGIFRAAEMTFADTYTVFIDPFWIDGIRLGTGDASGAWLADHRTPRFEELFGPLQVTTWQPAHT
jgi:hypothetical protein